MERERAGKYAKKRRTATDDNDNEGETDNNHHIDDDTKSKRYTKMGVKNYNRRLFRFTSPQDRAAAPSASRTDNGGIVRLQIKVNLR